MEIRTLHEGDDRSQFRSGDLDLDRFFHKFAGQNQFKRHLGVTYVAVKTGRILGFATVAPGHVEIDGLPAAARKKLPRYPLPVLRLARLAVDEAARGRGLGGQLHRFILQLALRMANEFGCVGVAVDAKSDAVAFNRNYGFISVDLAEGQSDARPSPIPMFLAIRAIREAVDGEDTRPHAAYSAAVATRSRSARRVRHDLRSSWKRWSGRRRPTATTSPSRSSAGSR